MIGKELILCEHGTDSHVRVAVSMSASKPVGIKLMGYAWERRFLYDEALNMLRTIQDSGRLVPEDVISRIAAKAVEDEFLETRI